MGKRAIFTALAFVAVATGVYFFVTPTLEAPEIAKYIGSGLFALVAGIVVWNVIPES